MPNELWNPNPMLPAPIGLGAYLSFWDEEAGSTKLVHEATDTLGPFSLFSKSGILFDAYVGNDSTNPNIVFEIPIRGMFCFEFDEEFSWDLKEDGWYWDNMRLLGDDGLAIYGGIDDDENYERIVMDSNLGTARIEYEQLGTYVGWPSFSLIQGSAYLSLCDDESVTVNYGVAEGTQALLLHDPETAANCFFEVQATNINLKGLPCFSNFGSGTPATPGTVNGWLKCKISGVTKYIPYYA